MSVTGLLGFCVCVALRFLRCFLLRPDVLVELLQFSKSVFRLSCILIGNTPIVGSFATVFTWHLQYFVVSSSCINIVPGWVSRIFSHCCSLFLLVF